MATIRKAVSQLVGGIQCVLGALASVFAFLIYTSSSLQETFVIASEGEVYLYMFLALVFGVFSILSGVLLVSEE